MNKTIWKRAAAALLLALALIAAAPTALAADGSEVPGAEAAEAQTASSKAVAAAVVVGLAATAGAISMGWAISRSSDSIARQPEAESKIRTSLMLGLVFIETVVIYALIVAILIIFVL